MIPKPISLRLRSAEHHSDVGFRMRAKRLPIWNGFNREASEFVFEAREQEARLVSLDLIPEADDGPGQVCPLVREPPSGHRAPQFLKFVHHSLTLQSQLRSVRRDVPRLQERLAALSSTRANLSEDLRGVQNDIAKRIQDSERLRLQQNQFTEQARVAGRIAYYLENAAAVAEDSELPRQLQQLRAEIAELEAFLDDDAAHDRLMTALNLVGRDLTAFATQLGTRAR